MLIKSFSALSSCKSCLCRIRYNGKYYIGRIYCGNDSIYLGIKPKRIVYRPVWPKTTPVLDRGDTLTSAKYGLPAIRGQGTAEVIYQQSIAKGHLPQGEDGITSITVSQNVDGNWIKVLNPDGDGYTAGDLNTVSFTMIIAVST